MRLIFSKDKSSSQCDRRPLKPKLWQQRTIQIPKYSVSSDKYKKSTKPTQIQIHVLSQK